MRIQRLMSVIRPLRAGVAVVSLIASAWWTSEAAAQQVYPRYTSPRGPTITPYLDYFRQDVGALNRYYTFVQPRAQLTSQIGQMQNTISQQQTEIKNLQGQIAKPRESGAIPTGVGGSFMNHMRYFGR